jgi:hypothetical protein
MPEVKRHIDSLFDRLRRPKAHGRPVLVHVKAITSPKETVEVQPFLVLSPSDIVTLVTSLFPERKSSPFDNRDQPKSGLASGASSISGISIPGIGSIARDGSSILSQSVQSLSSMTSDTTSRDHTQEHSEQQDHIDMPIEQREAAMVRPVPTEDYGRKLRAACSEMSTILGSDALSGTCHPCADRWAVLHISADGMELLTRMRKDVDDDDQEEDSPDSDSDDEHSSYGTALENDYHQLKDAIVRLLSEYELPKVLSDPTAFSNEQSPRRLRRSRIKRTSHSDDASSMPMHQSASQITNLIATQRSRIRRTSNTADSEDLSKENLPDLMIMLETAYQQCQSRNQEYDAYVWFKTIDQLKKLSTPSLTRDGYGPLLHYFGRGPKDSLTRNFSAIDEFEAWFVWLKQSQERHEAKVESMMRSFKHLRDKMWFRTAVVTSAVYEDARNLAHALKLMGNNIKPDEAAPKPVPLHRRGFSKPSITGGNFLLKTETQLFDLLAASSDHCGPNKLSDEQIDLTLKWLRDYSIERNFCQCEERIHRFNLEIDKCVNKLVGDGVLLGPVLWSSELYSRDKKILDSERTDAWLIGVNLCIPDADGESEKKEQPERRSLDLIQRRTKAGMKNFANHSSQQSVRSDWSGGTKGAVNIMDAQDYFGNSSPALEIDSTVTFWSPFGTSASQEDGHKKANRRLSATADKPITQKSPAALTDEKRRFLLDLKRTLTGLLLSDLGVMVFNSGSETDGWFSEEFVDECIKRKEADERRRKLRLARKKSTRGLKASREQQKNSPVTQASNGSQRSSPTINNTQPDDSTTGDSLKPKKFQRDFPFIQAYKKLLKKFSIHPNPFSKLEALYDLRRLIEHQLSVPSRIQLSLKHRREDQPTPRESPKPDTPTTTTQSGRGSPNTQPGARSTVSNSPPSINIVIESLQGLLCDPEMRPKTLFRDLQYIAAFIPADALDKTVQGKAFCDLSVAAVSLKDDVVRYMVEIADGIVQEDTEGRPMGPAPAGQSNAPTTTTRDAQSSAASASTAEPQQTPATSTPQPPVPTVDAPRRPTRYTMADAAKMYQIAAREGNPAAERELAIFYLTQPDITPRAMQPLAKPKDVFKNLDKMLSSQGRGKGASGEDSKRSDPLILCLAHHWMEMSKAGGDDLAANYLRDRDDMERIPGA